MNIEWKRGEGWEKEERKKDTLLADEAQKKSITK